MKYRLCCTSDDSASKATSCRPASSSSSEREVLCSHFQSNEPSHLHGPLALPFRPPSRAKLYAPFMDLLGHFKCQLATTRAQVPSLALGNVSLQTRPAPIYADTSPLVRYHGGRGGPPAPAEIKNPHPCREPPPKKKKKDKRVRAPRSGVPENVRTRPCRARLAAVWSLRLVPQKKKGSCGRRKGSNQQ